VIRTLIFLLFLPLAALAQAPAPGDAVPDGPALTLQQAVELALAQNYGIQIARRDVDIATRNVSRANAGQIPAADFNLTQSNNRINLQQQFEGRDPRITNNVPTSLLNANVALTWTIFDGLGMFVAYNRLKTLEGQRRQLTRATVEQTVADVTDAYFDVVRATGQFRALEAALRIGRERIQLTKAQVEVGVKAKVELLTAQVDYNADSSAWLQQQETLLTARIRLNELLSRDPATTFRATDSIIVARDLARATIAERIQAANPRLAAARLQVDVADQERRLIRASRYPSVGLTGGYGLTRNTNGAAFLPGTSQLTTNINRQQGFNYGVVATLPLFDGFLRRRQEQNARIVTEQSRFALDQTRLQLDSEAEQAWQQYQNRLRLLNLEEANQQLANQNVEIALERYRLGLLTPLVLREAQRSQLEAATRLLDIRYQAKQAETTLRRLTGELVKE
jgi:outer membrane protein